MTTITVLPEGLEKRAYRALAGGKESIGRTLGEALDALTPQLPDEDSDTVIIVKRNRPDRFFNEQQQKRLAELMEKLRAARDQEMQLPADEMRELENLVEAELRGAIRRTEAMFGALPA